MNKVLVAGVALLAACTGAHAVTSCSIASSGGLAFGRYDVLSVTPNDSLATITALCTRNGGPAGVTITLQLGRGTFGTSVNARRMLNAGAAGGFLNYGLFRDVGRSAVWGFSSGIDTMSQSISIPNRATVAATFTIYGRIPALQDVAVGSYFDQVTVTVTP